MLNSLFGKTMSREEIERDVTEQIESLARSGDHPAPAEWTIAHGLADAEPRPAASMEELADVPTPKRASSRKRARARESA